MKNNNTKSVGEKHAFVQGLGWATVEVKDGGKMGALTQYYRKWQACETNINRNFRNIAGRFYIVFQMNKAKRI